MAKIKSSSGNLSNLHKYVADGVRKLGSHGWTTSKIKRERDGSIKITIKPSKI